MEAQFENFRLSPLGIVPKKKLNSFPLIHHLSFPCGSSLNDSIDKDLGLVCYSTCNQAVELVRSFGQSALMAKADIQPAFCLLSIHPDGFNSLGLQFNGQFFCGQVSPYGVFPYGVFAIVFVFLFIICV